MNKLVTSKLLNNQRPYITDIELKKLLHGTADSQYSKVKRMLAEKSLIHIRRGLYCLTEHMGYLKKPHPYELAQYIYGPSYISLESALSFHQLIPEAVHTITSATIKRSNEFKTSLGIFSYHHFPSEDFYTEVELIEENGYKFLMAKPWKAICDYIFCYRKNWRSLEPLVKDLRIEKENLPLLFDEEKEKLKTYYHHNRINNFLKGIKQ